MAEVHVTCGYLILFRCHVVLLCSIRMALHCQEKLQQWQRMAEHGFQIHRRAERYYATCLANPRG